MNVASVIAMNHSRRYERELEGASTGNPQALAQRALTLIANGKATRADFQGLSLNAVTELIRKLEAQHFWLGKCANGSFLSYLSEKPLTVRRGREIVGVAGPFLSRLGAAYYARNQPETASLQALSATEIERLAREDDTGAWPLVREQILAEVSMSTQERDDYERDLAGEYDPC